MAFTVTKTRPFIYGDRQAVIADVAVSDYTTGGEVLTCAVLGLPSGDHPYIISCMGLDGIYEFRHVEATDKLIIAGGASVEIALHATASIRLVAVGPRAD